MKNVKAKNVLTEVLLQFRTELKNNDYHGVYFSRSQAGQEGSVGGHTGSDGGQGSGGGDSMSEGGDSMSEEGESGSEGSGGGDLRSENQTPPVSSQDKRCNKGCVHVSFDSFYQPNLVERRIRCNLA